jgi:hypothetical protein
MKATPKFNPRKISTLGLVTLAALGLAAGQSVQAQANLVQNSGFETLAPTALGNSQFNGSTAIPSWTVVASGNSQDVVLLANGNQYGVSTPYGTQFIDLTGLRDTTPYAGLTQSIPTVTGTNYLLTLSLGADQANGSFQGPVSVSASAGSTSQTFTFTPVAGSTGNVWPAFMMNFTASGTSTPLTITGASSGGGEYIGLDNVSVVAPEPSQTAALGLGVLGLAGLALKAGRRKTIA